VSGLAEVDVAAVKQVTAGTDKLARDVRARDLHERPPQTKKKNRPDRTRARAQAARSADSQQLRLVGWRYG
jgi:hypothetical protein